MNVCVASFSLFLFQFIWKRYQDSTQAPTYFWKMTLKGETKLSCDIVWNHDTVVTSWKITTVIWLWLMKSFSGV